MKVTTCLKCSKQEPTNEEGDRVFQSCSSKVCEKGMRWHLIGEDGKKYEQLEDMKNAKRAAK